MELEQVRSRLALAEKRAKEPPPLLLQLQTDLDAMKVSKMSRGSVCCLKGGRMGGANNT